MLNDFAKRHPMQFVFSSEVILTQISSFCTSIEVIEIIKLWNYAKKFNFRFHLIMLFKMRTQTLCIQLE